MQKPLVIFDFDGTIADTLSVIINIMNNLSSDFGFRKIQQEDVEYLRGKKPREILKHLGISMIKLPFVIMQVRKEINSQIGMLFPSVELLPLLKILKEQECEIGIVTTNIEENVRKFLHANKLDCFDFFYSSKKIFGKHRVLSKIIKDRQIEPSGVYFVCDEIRDIEAAKKAGIKAIAVSWGFNTSEVLKKQNPDYFVSSPAEIHEIIFPK